jgi:hypothetical protein
VDAGAIVDAVGGEAAVADAVVAGVADMSGETDEAAAVYSAPNMEAAELGLDAE